MKKQALAPILILICLASAGCSVTPKDVGPEPLSQQALAFKVVGHLNGEFFNTLSTQLSELSGSDIEIIGAGPSYAVNNWSRLMEAFTNATIDSDGCKAISTYVENANDKSIPLSLSACSDTGNVVTARLVNHATSYGYTASRKP